MLDLTGTDPDMLHKGTAGKGKKVCYYVSPDLIHYVPCFSDHLRTEILQIKHVMFKNVRSFSKL